ncbi:NACHT domain-containing protein [Pedobacter xixiisoli]|uniref:NACHT domain-containing protein n=1 Tax=Pedobacter xixiisoli TaxID=1476464 RepID=A0A285ZZR2_9SPHI|nr:NACHT domain-containing protein [Pedobacter xixiisoli]SOD15135.1 NACHT domain-containing protein [Pedobacter xixiisoli]
MILTTSIVATWLGAKIAEKSFDHIFSKYTNSGPLLSQELSEAVNDVSKKIQVTYPDVLGGAINHFFTKEEVFNSLLEHLFVYDNSSIEYLESFLDTSTLPENFLKDFITELKAKLLTKEEFGKILKDKEIYLIVRGISEELEEISSNSESTVRELQEIRRILSSNSNEFDFFTFYKKYRLTALNVLSQVNFLGLGIDSSIKKSRKKLEEIFVAPNFLDRSVIENEDRVLNLSIIDDSHISNDENEIDYPLEDQKSILGLKDFFDKKTHIVVLGNPGSGKSFLVKYIICSILNNQTESFKEQSIFRFLPIRIELRKYLSSKKKNSCHIKQYIIQMLKEDYQINISEKDLTHIINDKKILILFDGLDEIFDIEEKIEIKNDIENICLTNENILAMVTSRKIGYSDAKLNDDFSELEIDTFSDSQVVEYVSKWYLHEEKNEDIRKRELREFLEKRHTLDRELIHNPLLLSLIVILFRNNLKLPESKLEIYQSCTKTLVDKWDKTKDLQINLDEILVRKKETLLADLAFWQYTILSSDSPKITYKNAKDSIAKSIHSKLKLTEDWHDACDYAEQFLLYAENRSIYFENNFTHKTFLEYFTAYWIYSNCDKKQLSEERDKIIKQYIGNSFWSIVLELLFNMIDHDQPDSDIIDKLYNDNLKLENAYSFLIDVLPTLQNISNQIQVKTIKNALIFFVKNITLEQKNDDQLLSSLEKLTNHHSRFQKIIDSIIAEEIETTLSLSEIIVYGEFFIVTDLMNFEGSLTHKKLSDSKIFIDATKNDPFSYQLYHYFNNKLEGFDYVIDFIKNFKIQAIFNDHSSKFLPFNFIGVYNTVFRAIIKEDISSINKGISKLEDLGLSKILIKEKLSFKFINIIEDEFVSLIKKFNSKEASELSKLVLRKIISEVLRGEKTKYKDYFKLLPEDILS